MRVFLPIILVFISLKGGLVAQSPCADIAAVGAAWWADWGIENHCPDVRAEFVPHVCCAYVPDKLPDGTIWAMGPNEVNYHLPGSTCPLSPQEAAAIMRALNEAFPDVHWVGPSVSACHPHLDPRCSRDGIEWMAEYLGLCPDCQVALAAHWYCYDRRNLGEYLGAMASFGRPVWLTEWGCNDLDTAIASMEIINRMTARHAWFALRLGPEWGPPISEQTLVSPATGELTSLGVWYRDLR